ncbi:MAG: DNA replication/repair protein RecF [Hyphomicrobiales bacterium]|nr:DNA replication/repair protein RecF [Hyphomicrobiales bacterium]
MPHAPHVSRLALTDYRSFATLDLPVAGRMVALCGANGVGKTNILEALSLLSSGRGLRRAALSDCARIGGHGGFAVSVTLADEGGDTQLGTGLIPGETGRKARINREPVGSVAAFAEYVRVLWLTPSMDGLFNGPPGERRRFLDRLVLALDARHGARVAALERALSSRNRLLEAPFPDQAWLDACERELGEVAVAVAAARCEAVARLGALIAGHRDHASAFPWAEVKLQGELEEALANRPALEVEDNYVQILRQGRARDAAAGRTLRGPHASDLAVAHGPKQIEAARASTGEQKALLTGLVIAHARLVAETSGMAPLLLLDEIAAHFDPMRRRALFAELGSLGAQVWMTGADPAHFADLADHAIVLQVEAGPVRQR